MPFASPTYAISLFLSVLIDHQQNGSMRTGKFRKVFQLEYNQPYGKAFAVRTGPLETMRPVRSHRQNIAGTRGLKPRIPPEISQEPAGGKDIFKLDVSRDQCNISGHYSNVPFIQDAVKDLRRNRAWQRCRDRSNDLGKPKKTKFHDSSKPKKQYKEPLLRDFQRINEPKSSSESDTTEEESSESGSASAESEEVKPQQPVTSTLPRLRREVNAKKRAEGMKTHTRLFPQHSAVKSSGRPPTEDRLRELAKPKLNWRFSTWERTRTTRRAKLILTVMPPALPREVLVSNTSPPAGPATVLYAGQSVLSVHGASVHTVPTSHEPPSPPISQSDKSVRSEDATNFQTTEFQSKNTDEPKIGTGNRKKEPTSLISIREPVGSKERAATSVPALPKIQGLKVFPLIFSEGSLKDTPSRILARNLNLPNQKLLCEKMGDSSKTDSELSINDIQQEIDRYTDDPTQNRRLHTTLRDALHRYLPRSGGSIRLLDEFIRNPSNTVLKHQIKILMEAIISNEALVSPGEVFWNTGRSRPKGRRLTNGFVPRPLNYLRVSPKKALDLVNTRVARALAKDHRNKL